MIAVHETLGDSLRTVNGLSEKLHACFEKNRMPVGLAG
jgi:hypothetical protein